MFKHLLVPLDGSAYGERALSYAKALATVAGAEVSLLTVVPSAPETVALPASASHGSERRRTYLDEVAGSLREAGLLDVTTDVRAGEPAEVITSVARDDGVDLIVMSTEGLGARGEYALGSVALKVLMTAPCPVFMVRINRPEPPHGTAEERWQTEGGANTG